MSIPMYLFEKYIVTHGWYLHDVQRYSNLLLFKYMNTKISDDIKIAEGFTSMYIALIYSKYRAFSKKLVFFHDP